MKWSRLMCLAFALALSGCAEMVVRPQATTQAPVPPIAQIVEPVASPAVISAPAPEKKATPPNSSKPRPAEVVEDFWADLVAARRFTDCSYDPAIENWARRLTSNPTNFNAELARMLPYLDYVWRRTQALEMPAEVAFLPLVESNYRQVYGSYGSPGGWWQLMPATGRHYQLDVSRNNDERVDPVKSTDAALKLIGENAQRFNEDWLLAIFAYNVGGLRVQRVLDAKGLVPGQIEHVRQLNLPLTTEDHLHRLIGWGCIFADPQRYKVTLPPALTPEQRFTNVRIAHTTPLGAITQVLGEFAAEWKKQHPLVSKRGEIRYAQHVLAPATANTELAALGDLRRFRSTTPVLLANTSSAKPNSNAANAKASLATTTARANSAPRKRNTIAKNLAVPSSFKVRNGDNLWTIARRFDMRVKEILALNPGLSREASLKLGQVLRLK